MRCASLDSLIDQVHGGGVRPDYLDPEVELVVGDVRDPDAVRRALRDVDVVVHLAARVGVGQSMYELAEYTGANTTGTAVLLEALLDRPVERLVVASSMSVYGEGLYVTRGWRRRRRPAERPSSSPRGEWEPVDEAGRPLAPAPTPETKPPLRSTSVYALTKYDQERLCLIFGAAYGIPTVALRFFNTYGPRQALSNPYTGVLAIFASRLLNGRPPLDLRGRPPATRLRQRRRRRPRLPARARERPRRRRSAFNVGSGRPARSVLEIVGAARRRCSGREIEPEITGKFRVGDIRHCFADISLARELLGYTPEVDLETGLGELAGMARGPGGRRPRRRRRPPSSPRGG